MSFRYRKPPKRLEFTLPAGAAEAREDYIAAKLEENPELDPQSIDTAMLDAPQVWGPSRLKPRQRRDINDAGSKMAFEQSDGQDDPQVTQELRIHFIKHELTVLWLTDERTKWNIEDPASPENEPTILAQTRRNIEDRDIINPDDFDYLAGQLLLHFYPEFFEEDEQGRPLESTESKESSKSSPGKEKP